MTTWSVTLVSGARMSVWDAKGEGKEAVRRHVEMVVGAVHDLEPAGTLHSPGGDGLHPVPGSGNSGDTR